MDEKQFDTLIRRVLSETAEDVKVPSGLHKQIKETIHNQPKEAAQMRKGSIRKVVLIAAAFCILGTAAAIAAGRTTTLMTGSGTDTPTYTEFEQMLEESKKMGFPAQPVKEFDNGFAFKEAKRVTVQGMDDQGNNTISYDELSIEYRDASDCFLRLSINRTPAEVAAEQKTPVYMATKEINGISVGYKVDKYKFLPPDAKISEEDQQAQERGELYIAYGSSKEEVQNYHYVTWVQDGVDYLISCFDRELSAEDMFAMAEATIAAK